MKTEQKKPTLHFERVPLTAIRNIGRTATTPRPVRQPVAKLSPSRKGRDPYSIHPED